MADFAAIPLFTDAFMADTGHLTDAECGVYLRLLMTIWRSPGCRIPNDEAWLAKRFGRTVEQYRSEVLPVVREFCTSDGNWLTQKRLSREFAYVTIQSRKQSVRAKSRWLKEKASCLGSTTSGIAPSPSPTPTEEEERKKASAADAALKGTPEEADYFRRGKQILGPSAGGFLVQLRNAKAGNIALARAALEQATAKQDPREYLARVIRGQASSEAEQNKKVEEIMRKKGCAVVFADEVPGGIPGIV